MADSEERAELTDLCGWMSELNARYSIQKGEFPKGRMTANVGTIGVNGWSYLVSFV
jgi:hypothetical protein